MTAVVVIATMACVSCTSPRAPEQGDDAIAACDEWVTKYLRCIEDKMPAESRQRLLDGISRSAATWSATATTSAGRAALGKACTDMMERARAETSGLGCKW